MAAVAQENQRLAARVEHLERKLFAKASTEPHVSLPLVPETARAAKSAATPPAAAAPSHLSRASLVHSKSAQAIAAPPASFDDILRGRATRAEPLRPVVPTLTADLQISRRSATSSTATGVRNSSAGGRDGGSSTSSAARLFSSERSWQPVELGNNESGSG